MPNGRKLRIALAASLLLAACSAAQPRSGAEQGELASLADRYFDEVCFKYSPTRATRAGLHAYDARLEDFSRSAIDAQVAALKDFEDRVQKLQPPGRTPDAAADRDLLLSDIRSRLLELTTIRRWEKDPNVYSSGITESAFVIMSRNFASPDQTLSQLLELGMADLRRNQREFQRVARHLAPDRAPQHVLQDLGADHPPPAGLLQAFRDTFGYLRGFIDTRRIVTVPSPVLPIVEETPPFMRALTFASMDTPGPFEKAKEAFFNVTLPEQTWTPEQVEEHMAGFNRGTVISTAIHEAYPGHYVQLLWVQRAPKKVRQLLGCASNLEGWAHYTEQMMLDEGYGRTAGLAEENDTAFLKLRLGQLQDALLRNARYVVGIRMHTGEMTFEQAVEFFEKEGYQSPANALRETKRGTSDPTYLVYTLGKLQILKLRDDYRRKAGASFQLQEFQHAFLPQAFPPVKIIRRTLLGDDGPSL